MSVKLVQLITFRRIVGPFQGSSRAFKQALPPRTGRKSVLHTHRTCSLVLPVPQAPAAPWALVALVALVVLVVLVVLVALVVPVALAVLVALVALVGLGEQTQRSGVSTI